MTDKSQSTKLPSTKIVIAMAHFSIASMVIYKLATMAGSEVTSYCNANGLESQAFTLSIVACLLVWFFGFMANCFLFLKYMTFIAGQLPPQTAMFKPSRNQPLKPLKKTTP